MDLQRKDGEENKPTPKPEVVEVPTVITTRPVPPNHNILWEFIVAHKKLFKWGAIITVATALIAGLAQFTAIPNNIINAIKNWRELNSPEKPEPQSQVALTPKPPLAWQPPELHPDMRTATFCLDLVNCPSFALERLKTNYWPQSHSAPFSAFVADNRVYVRVRDLFGMRRQTTVDLTEETERQFSRDGLWDRNFNSNSFERIKYFGSGSERRALPILQIIYHRPNDIIINGLFIDTNGYYRIVFYPDRLAGNTYRTNQFPWASVTNKPMFMYPSSRYQGVLAP